MEQKSGMQEELENAGYIFSLSPKEYGSLEGMGFFAIKPIPMHYSPPPQVGLSLEDIQVEIVRMAWKHYQYMLKVAVMEAELNELRELKAQTDFIAAAFEVALEDLQSGGNTEENRQNYHTAITLQSQFFATYKPRK